MYPQFSQTVAPPVQPTRQQLISPKLFITIVSFFNGLFTMRALGEFLFEKERLGLSPNAIQLMVGVATAPLTLKPFFGFVFDTIVKHTRQTKYTVAFFSLLRSINAMIIYYGNLNWFSFGACLLLNGVCSVFETIAAESSLLRLTREAIKLGKSKSEQENQLPIFYGFKSLGAIIGVFVGGRLISWFSLEFMFLTFAIVATVLAVVCLIYDELPITNYVTGDDLKRDEPAGTRPFMELMRELLKDPHVFGVIAYIFLVHFTPTYDSLTMFYLNDEQRFNAKDLSDLSAAALITNVVGMYAYSKWLCKLNPKIVFLGGNAVLWAVNLLFLGVVAGFLNQNYHFVKLIAVLYFGVNSMVAEVTFMPALTICCQYSPFGYEATTLSLFSGLNTFSYNIGTYLGIILTALLEVKEGKLENYPALLIIQNTIFAITLAIAAVNGFPSKREKTKLS